MYTENIEPNFVFPGQQDSQPVTDGNEEVKTSTTAEWWQVLTIVTLILSIASLFLAFNQIQPEVYRNEFLAIDQAKASVYLIYDESNGTDYEDFTFVSTPKKEKLCEENYTQKVISTDLDKETTSIRDKESRLQTVEEDTSAKVQVLTEESGINDLFSSANTSLVEKRLFFEKKFLLDGNKSNIYRSLSNLCRNPDHALAELNTINISLDDLSELDGVNREKLADLSLTIDNWKRNVEAIDFEKVFKETPEVDNLITELNDIDNFYQKFAKSKTDLRTEFGLLEKWQLDFTEGNQELKDKLVLIEEIEHGSTT